MKKVLVFSLALLFSSINGDDSIDIYTQSTEEIASQCEYVNLTISIRLDRASLDLDKWTKQIQPYHDLLTRRTKSNLTLREALDQLNSIAQQVDQTFSSEDAHGQISFSSRIDNQ